MNYCTSAPLLIRADWVWTATGTSLHKGAVMVEKGLIAAVLTEGEVDCLVQAPAGQNAPIQIIDAKSSVITPGLFNLHTHLDYSQAPAIDRNLPLFTWMAQLVKNTRSWPREKFEKSALAGARQAALAGSSYTGCAAEALAEVGLKGLVGLELFGLDRTAAERIFANWSERYQSLIGTAGSALRAALKNGSIAITVAPHAPYTVSPALWNLANQWATSNNLILLAHLAESQAEADWIAGESATLDHYLAQVMPPDPCKSFPQLLAEIKANWTNRGRTPTAHLAAYGLLDENLLAAHCVNLSKADFEIFGKSGARSALCRRSNTRLLTGIADCGAFTAHHVRFGLGSDSLASCDDLQMLKEAAAWRADVNTELSNGLSAAQCLNLITISAAEAVNQSHLTGSLTAGKAADLAIFPLKNLGSGSNGSDLNELLAEALLKETPTASALLVDGKFIVRQGKVLADS